MEDRRKDEFEICHKLEDVRVQRGMTRRELAVKCRTTYKNIYKWEKEKKPRLENLVMLTDALGITLDELVHWNTKY